MSKFFSYEVWELDDSEVRLRDIVEEALVMALPFASMHALRDDCSGDAGALPTDKSESQRPFAELKTIMADADKEQ